MGVPEDAAAESAEAGEEGAAAAGAAPVMASAPGAINSTTDVLNTLDRIIAYNARVEPSSPVPVLLTRAKTLVGADFMTVVRDMAPAGMEMVRIIGGIRDE